MRRQDTWHILELSNQTQNAFRCAMADKGRTKDLSERIEEVMALTICIGSAGRQVARAMKPFLKFHDKL